MHSELFRAPARFFAVAAIALAGFAFAGPALAGTSDNVAGWLWSGSVGWISMNCTNPIDNVPPRADPFVPTYPAGTCATVDYGVRLDNVSGTPAIADMKGYGWSQTVGWVCFGSTCTDTTPEGGTSYAQYRETWNGKTDQMWGWAQVIGLGSDGWISLNCDKDVGPDECASSNYFVSLSDTLGDFSNGGVNDHWGWGGTDEGTGVGWVDFTIATTTWTPSVLGTIRRPAGIFEPFMQGGACVTNANCTTAPYLQCNGMTATCVPAGTHLSAFPITFQGFSGSANDLLECEVLLPDASRRRFNKVLTTTVRNGTETLTYTIQPADAVPQNSLWYITQCQMAGVTTATACVTDAACGAGKLCDETVGFCRNILTTSTRLKPVYAHASAWTGLGAQQDQYLAIKCNAGFPDNYFKNAAQCDFTADASFALSMRRGIPIEGNCADSIDNDGNGQIDCADRYCRGISYFCGTLPRTACTWNQAGDGVNDCSALPADSGICCSRQPLAPGSAQSHIVDGLECVPGDANDGYYDCGCTNAAAFNASAADDCFAPGYQTGDLCCDVGGNVLKQ